MVVRHAADGTSLLQALLRHAMLREIAERRPHRGSAPGASVAALLQGQELVDLVDRRAAHRDVAAAARNDGPGVTGDKTIRQFLEGLTAFDAPTVAALGDFRESLAHCRDSTARRCSI